MSTSIPISSSSRQARYVPAVMERTLRVLRLRGWLLMISRGLAIAMAVLVIAMVLAMALDWMLTLFDWRVRLSLTLTVMGLAGFAFWQASASRLRRVATLQSAARQVDAAVPALQQRWSTVTALDGTWHSHRGPNAQSMQDQVAAEAVAMKRLVAPSQIFPLDTLRIPACCLVAAIAVWAGFMMLQWDQTSVLLRRFWSPAQNITATQLVSVTGDQWVPRGESVTLRTRLTGVHRSNGELEVRHPSGLTDQFVIEDIDENADEFDYSLRVDESIEYRVRSGDGQTQWHRLTVIDYPEIAEIQLRLTPPEYVGEAVVAKDYLPRRMKVVDGSHLTIALKPVEELQSMRMHLQPSATSSSDVGVNEENSAKESQDRELATEMLAGSDGWYRFESMLHESMTLQPRLVSPYGLTDESPRRLMIEVEKDQAPVARIIAPTDEASVAEDAILDINFEAHDDHAIARAELIVYDESVVDEAGNPMRVERFRRSIPLGDQSGKSHVNASTQLDLNQLNLPPGSRISFAIEVSDNREVETGESPDSDRQDASRDPTWRDSVDRTSDSSLTTASSAEFKKPRVVRERNATDVAVSMTRQQSETSRPNLDRLSQGNSRDSLNHAKPDSPETQSDEGLDQRFRRRPREQDQRRPQSSQATLTSRRTIQIVKRLTSIAEAEGDFDEEPSARKWVQQIDQLLSQVEAGLTDLIDHQIADADRSEQFKRLDEGLGQVEDIVATIREVTKDNEFTFVGLQMLDLSRDHVTPARDRVFNGIRNPNAGKASPEFARGHIRRARNKLAALLKQVDAVARERKLADAIDETVEIYRVYIEKRHRLMRQARQNKHPLPRKLGIIEVDQAYLDRYAEVLRLRRDMLDEFSTMLGDDPRLLSRYMDLIQRRRRSLREQLADIADAQDEVMIETAGWLEIDPEQRPDFWTIISEMRLQVADELIENMAESTERIKKQLPLSLDIDRGTPRDILQLIETIQSVTPDSMTVGSSDGETMAQRCVDWIAQLNEKLTRLEFEYEQNDDVADFVAPRLVETTLLMQEAAAWARIADQLHLESYSGLVAIDQQQLATTSQLFLTETMSIGDELEREFQRIAELEVPDTILKLVSDFQQLVQDIVFNQAAAAYAASMNDLDATAQQQALAMTNIEAAEASFDQFRRGVVDFLDSYDMRDPNIADLRDPTLDEFLARLEREPNIARQLGIPRRRSNLKVIADSMLWSQMEGQLLSASGDAARQRAKQARRKREASRNANANSKRVAKAKQDVPLTEEQRDELEKARKLQENLEKQLLTMRKKMDDPKTTRGQRDALKKVADEMKTMLDRSAGQASATLAWQQLAQTDQAKAVMRAMERGDEVPDEQWNELFSRLGDGLWQVRGKQPPEIYRKAIEQYQDRLRVLLGRQAVGS